MWAGKFLFSPLFYAPLANFWHLHASCILFICIQLWCLLIKKLPILSNKISPCDPYIYLYCLWFLYYNIAIIYQHDEIFYYKKKFLLIRNLEHIPTITHKHTQKHRNKYIFLIILVFLLWIFFNGKGVRMNMKGGTLGLIHK